MKKYRILYEFSKYIFILIVCANCMKTIEKDVTTFNIAIDKIEGYLPDNRYILDQNNSNYFFHSNAIAVLDHLYKNRKKDTESYEVGWSINWNSKANLLFIEVGSPCLNYYNVYKVNEEDLSKLAKLKMDFKKDGFPKTFDLNLNKVTDSLEVRKLTDKYLISNGCGSK